MKRIETLAKRLAKLEAIHKPPGVATIILATDEREKARQIDGLQILPSDRGPMICLTGRPISYAAIADAMKAVDGRTRGIPSRGARWTAGPAVGTEGPTAALHTQRPRAV